MFCCREKGGKWRLRSVFCPGVSRADWLQCFVLLELGTTKDLCWRDIETLSLCGLMWKRFQRVSQSLVRVIKRTRWRIKQISLSLSLWLLCSSCEAVGGSHLCLFCLCNGWIWCFHWVRAPSAGGGVSAACCSAPAKRPRGEWHSYAWSFTPRRFLFCLFFFFEFTQSSSSNETPDDVDVSQTALLLFALYLWKYERPKRGPWALEDGTGRNDMPWSSKCLDVRFACSAVA